MEDIFYKIEIISLLRKAVSITYSELELSKHYHECMEYLNENEEKLIENHKNEQKFKQSPKH